MEKQSVFECINNQRYASFKMKIPQLNTPYTIIELIKRGTFITAEIFCTHDMVLLKELRNDTLPLPDGSGFYEQHYLIEDFRELQLPGEVAEVLERELQLI